MIGNLNCKQFRKKKGLYNRLSHFEDQNLVYNEPLKLVRFFKTSFYQNLTIKNDEIRILLVFIV